MICVILNGPILFSASFLFGVLILRFFVSNQTLWPTLYSGASDLFLSANLFIDSWALLMAALVSSWIWSILSAKSALDCFTRTRRGSMPIRGCCPALQ